MVVWELLAPLRDQRIGRLARWPSNFGVVALDALVVRLLLPIGAVALALLAEPRGWGLFNALGLPAWAGIPLGVIVLDLVIYLQHVLFHAVPALWRLHRVHHADLDFDVTTGVRFHPIEILLSLVIKVGGGGGARRAGRGACSSSRCCSTPRRCSTTATCGCPAARPRAALVVVTPEMHRVHHSVKPRETNSNFGFNLPWWDRLFGTYRAQPAAGHCGDGHRHRSIPGRARAAARPHADAAIPGRRGELSARHREPANMTAQRVLSRLCIGLAVAAVSAPFRACFGAIRLRRMAPYPKAYLTLSTSFPGNAAPRSPCVPRPPCASGNRSPPARGRRRS